MELPGKDTLDYMAILRGMWRRHKLLVAAIFFALAIPLVALVYFTSRTFYLSAATIAIESSSLDQSPLFKDLTRKDTITTYLVILKSRSFSEAVIEALPKESFEELLTESQYTDYVLTLTNMVKGWLGRPPTVLSPQQRAVAELRNARMEFARAPAGCRYSQYYWECFQAACRHGSCQHPHPSPPQPNADEQPGGGSEGTRVPGTAGSANQGKPDPG